LVLSSIIFLKDSRKISQIFLEDGREDPREIKRSRKIPRKTPPNTQKYEGNSQPCIQALLTKRPAGKKAKRGTG
jgi:hypothetical protein